MLERLADIEARYIELEQQLTDPEVIADHRRVQELAQERSDIETVVHLYRQYRDSSKQLEDAKVLLREGDDEMRDLAREEVDTLTEEVERLNQELTIALLPKDPKDERDVIVEIRAGAGGDEAGLFASDLYGMYQRYAEREGWKTEVTNTSANEAGGYREIVFEIHGRGAYSRLKYESGVHRVQRVPATEAQGRIHTSTATVAVMPEVDEVDVDINWNDVRIDIFHSGGAGGQNVNKVATAVRMTHIPTGIVVTCQDERSQAKNRSKAEAQLRAKLYALEREAQDSEVAALRKSQVGSGDRAEKIRTYNYPQDRITDHRIGLTVHGIPKVMDGDLDGLIDAVASEDQARALAATA
ncbi:MAG: peptide chain release factor 1 [Dehalococcoidia bacterium]|nr:peptide chain release factor 1 [Dehalococcoidia bacterium]